MDPNAQQPSIFDDPRLQQASQSAQQLGQQAFQAEQSGFTLPDMLRDALNKKFANNPVLKQRESALQNYLTVQEQAPLSVLPENTGGRIFSPQEQSAIIGGKRAAALAPLTTANELVGMSQGGIDDILNAATRSYQAYTTGLMGKAQLARQKYSDVLDELSNRAAEAERGRQANLEERKFAESTRQFNAQLAKSGGGGTSGERAESNARSALQRDIKRGTTFTDLVRRYGADLPSYEIRELYNAGPVAKKYGKAKEGEEDVQDILAGGKLTGKQRQEIKTSKTLLQGSLKTIQKAREALSTSGSGAQYTDIFGIREKLPGGLPGTARKTKSIFSQANTELFKVAGKAFTGPERSIIEGIVLDISKDPTANREALNQAEELIKQRLDSYGIETDTKETNWEELLKKAGL